jgi:hypothetical protein
MKKSEAIKHIVDTMKDRSGDDPEELAFFILQVLEEIGMEPPAYRYWNSKNPTDVNERGVPKDLQYSPFNGDYLNSWEEE